MLLTLKCNVFLYCNVRIHWKPCKINRPSKSMAVLSTITVFTKICNIDKKFDGTIALVTIRFGNNYWNRKLRKVRNHRHCYSRCAICTCFYCRYCYLISFTSPSDRFDCRVGAKAWRRKLDSCHCTLNIKVLEKLIWIKWEYPSSTDGCQSAIHRSIKLSAMAVSCRSSTTSTLIWMVLDQILIVSPRK